MSAESNSETLRRQIRDLGIPVSKIQEGQLRTYLEMLTRWNRSMNLTALEGARLNSQLIVEPLWVAGELAPEGRYLDVGSGNGSPALPWQVLCSFLSVDLVEPRRRRAVFLEQTVQQMGLSAVAVHPSRIEDIGWNCLPVDWITLQGLKLTTNLLNQLAAVSHEKTRLVWFTGTTEAPFNAQRCLQIPNSRRRALVFSAGSRT